MDRFVIYLKESGSISDMLACMGASVAMLDFENIRVVKEMKNNVNRKVNCETANIGKMVDAAVREINDIKLIDETFGLDSLSQKLQETARLRLEHPEMPLKELGEMHNPPVGKSGVNHRLRRIAKIALDIKDQEESKQS
jgi:DNA-binding protein WhiA